MSPQASHPFDQWFDQHQNNGATPMPRAKALTLWNSLIDSAIEPVWITKDQYVAEGEFDSASLALAIKELLEKLKGSVDPTAAPSGRKKS